MICTKQIFAKIAKHLFYLKCCWYIKSIYVCKVKQTQRDMSTQTRIEEIKAIFASWEYNEYGTPIGVDVNEWISLRDELEALEA